MTLDEAIEHVADKAIELKDSCPECAQEHVQLYGWLSELKAYRIAMRAFYRYEENRGDTMTLESILEDRALRGVRCTTTG